MYNAGRRKSRFPDTRKPSRARRAGTTFRKEGRLVGFAFSCPPDEKKKEATSRPGKIYIRIFVFALRTPSETGTYLGPLRGGPTGFERKTRRRRSNKMTRRKKEGRYIGAISNMKKSKTLLSPCLALLIRSSIRFALYVVFVGLNFCDGNLSSATSCD